MASDAAAPDLRLALRAVAAVLKRGAATHGPDAWRKKTARRHAAHSTVHLEKYLLGAHSKEDDLANGAVRALMALQLREEQAAANREAHRG